MSWFLKRRLIIGGAITGLGVVGWYLGYIFSSPSSLAAGHVILYPLGQIAVVVGPIVAAVGGLTLVAFRKDLHLNKSGTKMPQSGPMAPEKKGWGKEESANGKAPLHNKHSFSKALVKKESAADKHEKLTVSFKVFLIAIIVLVAIAAGIAIAMNSQIAALQANVNSITATSNNIQNNYNNLLSENSSTQNELSSLETQYNSLLNQSYSLNATVNFLNGIVTMNDSKVLSSVPQGQNESQYVWYYSESYAGYISINVENPASNSSLVELSYNSYGANFSQTVTVGENGTVVFPVLPANDIRLSFSAPAFNGTIMVMYYY